MSQQKQQWYKNGTKNNNNHHNRYKSEMNKRNQFSLVQDRLRREIRAKFHKLSRHDQINCSTSIQHKKSSSSFLVHNPLTKSSFSISDAITHKSAMRQLTQPFKPIAKSSASSRQKVNLSYRQRYNSFADHDLFQTKVQAITPRLYATSSTREAIKRNSVEPIQNISVIRQRNYKFKLLFREKTSQYKTVSERKLAKIEIKINTLKDKKALLKSLMPRQKPKQVVNRPKPRGEVVKKDKIMSLALALIKYVQLYFNMYQHNNIVGGHLKNIEGFNNRVRQVLMLDSLRAKRIAQVEEITNHFWSFKDESIRPIYFGEEDLALYNILNGYSFKMQKKYNENLTKFNFFEAKKRREERQSCQKSKEKFEKKIAKHEPINQINKFIEQRVRFDQGSREQYMAGLEKRGVKLNIIQRSRQLVLREKEMAMKEAVQNEGF